MTKMGSASVWMEPDDEVHVRYEPARVVHYGGNDEYDMNIPPYMSVTFGDVRLNGTPDQVLGLLDDALTRGMSIMDGQEDE